MSEVRDHGGVVQTVPLTKSALSPDEDLQYAVKTVRSIFKWLQYQRAKKVASDSQGLVDFSIGLVNSVFNLPDGQVMFFEEFE